MNKLSRILALGLLFAAFPLGVGAQEKSSNELKYEINQIKKDPQYLYAESTTEGREEAMNMAVENLEGKARMWAKLQREVRQLPADLVLTDINKQCGRIEMPRGNMNRAFAYIKKEDVFRSGGSRAEARNQRADAARSQMESAQVQPFGSGRVAAPAAPASAPAIHPAVSQMLKIKKYDDLVPLLGSLKNQGLISSYARYAQLTNPSDYVLVIYNRQAEIEAVLSAGAARTNLATSAPDDIANYKGRGAIGVKLQ